MTNKDTPAYLKPYQDAVHVYGGTFDATLWRSREGQVIRFKAFCDRIDFSNLSILDVGCGVGDFAQFLLDQGIDYASFHGIDAMDAMVTTAKNRSLPRSTFETCDVVTNQSKMKGYDWITCSGTLNAMGQSNAMQLIEAACGLCNAGVAYNFLSNKSGRDPATEDLRPATRFDTMAMIRHALTMSPLVEFTQSYLDGHDATIILRRHRNRPSPA